MDIEILLLLQNLRNSLEGVLNEFFALITNIGVDYYIILIPLIIFWAFDTKKGLFIYLSYGLSLIFNALLKSTFCIYRPWIRDPRVKPLESVVSGATGFSFPSGHSTSVSSTYSATIKQYKNKKLTIFCIAMIALTMFSRLFVGVHTPQDVLVGLLTGIAATYIISFISNYLEKNPKKDTLFFKIAAIFTILALLYVGIKNYPMDYVDGKLLVDPAKMKIDSFKDPGTFFGIMIAWYLDRKVFKTDISGTTTQKTIRCIFGALLMIAYYSIVINGIGKLINTNFVYFVLKVSVPILFINIYPLTWSKK